MPARRVQQFLQTLVVRLPDDHDRIGGLRLRFLFRGFVERKQQDRAADHHKAHDQRDVESVVPEEQTEAVHTVIHFILRFFHFYHLGCSMDACEKMYTVSIVKIFRV